jgi:hypothetical protein
MRILIAAGVALFTTASAHATTYVGGYQFEGIYGKFSLTTDGSFGAITEDNVTDFSVSLNDAKSTVFFSKSMGGYFNAEGLRATGDALILSRTGEINLFDQNWDSSDFSSAMVLRGQFTSNVLMNDSNGFRRGYTGVSVGVIGRIGDPLLPPTETPAAVPELGTWAMMIIGMGLIGRGVRRYRVRTNVRFA